MTTKNNTCFLNAFLLLSFRFHSHVIKLTSHGETRRLTLVLGKTPSFRLPYMVGIGGPLHYHAACQRTRPFLSFESGRELTKNEDGHQSLLSITRCN